MPVPDARTRSKISLNPSRVLSTSIPSRLLPNLLLSNALFVASLLAGREWILDYEVGVFWITMRVLACGGVGVIAWEGLTGQLSHKKAIEWPVLGIASLLLFVQQGCLFTALFRLSPIRVLLFTQFSTVWVDALMNLVETRKMNAILCAFALAMLSDAHFSAAGILPVLPGYLAVIGHGLTSTALDHTHGVLNPGLGTTFTIAATNLGASLFALPFYIFRTFLLGFPPSPVLSLFSLALIPFIAYSLLFLSQTTERSLKTASPIPRHLALSFPFSFGCAIIFGTLAFSQKPSWTDGGVGLLLYVGMYPSSVDNAPIATRTPTSRLIRSYLKTILSNPESRKIFYFLLLNMCYMLVQMLYGIWTNSLGLISDAIHMAFDCMAIGVGLFASVMATWQPNETFTYGYGRIETLSGFANGIFLILISIFIVFEAIQRILDPPEMDTSQLLLVSSLGLGVNLFGMFAMGGHHHGHSHSHGHSHGGEGHGHSHTPSAPVSAIHSHSHSHSSSPPDQAHSGEHSHSHSLPLESGRSHSHSEVDHSHSSSHSDSHSHSHDDHSHTHSSGEHAHSHGPENHTHSNSHSDNHTHAHHHVNPSSLVPEKQIKRNFLGPALRVNDDLIPDSPLTPSYSFTHDEHYQVYHAAPAPNLHNHSHAPSHEGHSHNMRGVFLHVLADTLGSVGVIISTLLIQFYGWTGFDPIASLFIAVLIAGSVLPLVLDTGKVLALDIDDRATNIQKALTELSSIEGLSSYSHPRFWPKDPNSLIGSIHIQLAPSAAGFDPHGPHSAVKTTYTKLDRVVERVDSLLRQKISGLEELTIQVEEG
ncbi:cation efflux family-domain-containing protein [Rhodocollybia butyracea]|uniref:Cation efflux family-domain-containing protein n=1 Tax=Rhodocollybia butyracea TaxID=206335 RepID=A0A9P5UGY1_9AGAR|nr:cation efflux family-domain-containing protein [Rhodocollybia butyracea]